MRSINQENRYPGLERQRPLQRQGAPSGWAASGGGSIPETEALAKYRKIIALAAGTQQAPSGKPAPDGQQPARARLFWLAACLMAACIAAAIFLLSFPPLLRAFRWNRFITRFDPLFTSILVTAFGSALSLLPTFFAGQKSKKQTIFTLATVLAGAVILLIVVNHIIGTHFETLTLTDADTGERQQYFGEIVGEVPSGEGRLFAVTGDLVYFGGFQNGKYDGYGEKYQPVHAVGSAAETGYVCVYEGGFQAGEYNGTGREYRYDAEYTFEKPDGISPALYYEGGFRNGEYCGVGTLYNTHRKYQGGFFANAYSGYGELWTEYTDGVFRFEGCFVDGILQGDCTKYYPNGQPHFAGEYQDGYGVLGTLYLEDGTPKYTGSLKNDKYHGTGTLYWENGLPRYEGDWYEGQRSGNGVSYYESGQMAYAGGWADDERSGYGTAYYGTGQPYYVGYWQGGQMNGAGILYHMTGEKDYEGDFLTDRRSGFGTAYYQNEKPKYIGHWENDLYSGEGEEFWENGVSNYKGSFVNGLEEGYGIVYTRDGEKVYEGWLAGGQYQGFGTRYWPNGQVNYSGEWKDGEALDGPVFGDDGRKLGNVVNGEFVSVDDAP